MNTVKQVKVILFGITLIAGTIVHETKTAAAAPAGRPSFLRGLYDDIVVNGIWKNVATGAKSAAVNLGTVAVGGAAYALAGWKFGYMKATIGAAVCLLAGPSIIKSARDGVGKAVEDVSKETVKVAWPFVGMYGVYKLGQWKSKPAVPTSTLQQVGSTVSSQAGSFMQNAWQRGKWPLAAAAATGAAVIALKKFVFDPADRASDRMGRSGAGRPAAFSQ